MTAPRPTTSSRCPSRRSTGVNTNGIAQIDYLGNAYNCYAASSGQGVIRPYFSARVTMVGVTDGTSNTIAVGERSHNLSYVTWTARSINGWLGKTLRYHGDGQYELRAHVGVGDITLEGK